MNVRTKIFWVAQDGSRDEACSDLSAEINAAISVLETQGRDIVSVQVETEFRSSTTMVVITHRS